MTSESLALGVIPARADSTRFPRKVLAPIFGKPMVQYVWEAAMRAKSLSRVIVATDDETIAGVVREFGGEAVLTPSELPSGTDRVAFAMRDCPGEIIINLQADEPLLDPKAIDQLVAALREDPTAQMATLAVASTSEVEFNSPNVVKVAISSQGDALYFSRASLKSNAAGHFYKHVGIYGFRREALFRFCELPVSNLERAERLEQLRALEAGFRIRVVKILQDTTAVDTPEDLLKVEARLRSQTELGAPT